MLEQELCKIYNVVSTPGRRDFYPHHHSELELAYFKSGRGIYSVTGCEYPIEAGDIFIFSNNEIHKITYVDESERMEAMNIHFLPQLLLSPEPSAIGLPRLFHEHICGNRITADSLGNDYGEVRRLLSLIETEDATRRIGWEMVEKQSLCQILLMILRNAKLTDTPSSQGTTDSIAAVLDYLDKNYLSEITISTLCGIARQSRSCFERMFGQLAGVTVSEYVKRRRIDHAISLLRTTNMTVLDIALASGYHNTANFNKQFKSVTHTTPAEYRRSL